MDHQIYFQQPISAQRAALKIAQRQKPGGLTDLMTVEFMCMAGKSPWYFQAKNWIDNPPQIGGVTEIFQRGCQALVTIVDTGYVAQTNAWWMPLVPKEDLRQMVVDLHLLGMIVGELRHATTLVISRGFETFLDIYLGKDWEKHLKTAIRETRKNGRT